MGFLKQLIEIAFSSIEILIFIRVILSWVLPGRSEFATLVYNITEPILKPFRAVIPMGHMRMDLSPIVAIFVLQFLQKIIINLLR